ncbi:MAG: PA14 domain-containing protein, partial [Chloroflexia bacterium]
DNGGFWPTDKPILNGALAVLFLLGLGWLCLKIRDPRYAMLAAWFWIGLIGVIVTVETPNYQRMGTAIPTLALIPALVLDNLIRRVQVLASKVKITWTSPATVGATAVAALVVIGIGMSQATFYFNDYGKRDRYPQPTIQGQAVRDQGADTLTITMGSSYHMINSGWIQLLAPETPRGGMRFPGSDLPMTTPAGTNLAFMIYPVQKYYLPYLQDLYPTGVTEVYTHPTENTIVTIYRISQADWATQQGATAQVDGGSPAHVSSLGILPTEISSYPARVIWTSGLRIPAYWNYGFRSGPGPISLTIDGKEVLNVSAGAPSANATVALAAGDHIVSYGSTVESVDKPPLLEWAQDTKPNGDGTKPELQWSAIPTEVLFANKTQLNGLYGVVQVDGRPEEHYLSNTVAQCCLNESLRSDGRPYTVNWTGSIAAPVTGLYTMTLTMHGTGSLMIDGREVIRRDEISEQAFSGGIDLDTGKHSIALKMEGQNTRGDVELRWTPPNGIDSIVPPSALTPPPDMVVPKAPLDLERFRDVRVILQHNPLETIR